MDTRISFAKIYIIIIYLFPSFFGYVGTHIGQLIYLSMIALFSLLLIFIYGHKENICNIHIAIMLFLLLTMHYCFSTIINFETNSPSLPDLFELFRPFIYIGSFICSASIISPWLKKEGKNEIFIFIENMIFICSFFELLKFIPSFYPLAKLYTVFPYGSLNYVRLSGFTGFAYLYAWVLLFALFVNVLRNHGKIGLRFFYYSMLVVLTGSRTGVAALLLSYCLMFIYIKRVRIKIFVSVIVVIISVLILYISEIELIKQSVDYSIRLIEAVMGKASDGSLNTRIKQYSSAIYHFGQSPLFGVGSNKESNLTIENFYFHHLRNWGIIGISIFLLFILSFRCMLIGKENKILFSSLFIISLLIGFSTPIFDQVRIFNIFYLILSCMWYLPKKQNVFDCKN